MSNENQFTPQNDGSMAPPKTGQHPGMANLGKISDASQLKQIMGNDEVNEKLANRKAKNWKPDTKLDPRFVRYDRPEGGRQQ